MNYLHYLFTAIAIIATIHTNAQTLSAKVVDAKTGDPIAFATIKTGKNQGVITNEEGVFTVISERLDHPQDSIFVSSMGYTTMGAVLSSSETVLELAPKEFELDRVFVSGNKRSPEEIVEKIKENLASNYAVDVSKKKIFFRQSNFNTMDQVDFGFQKSTIAELDKQLIDSIANLIPRKSWYYREVVGDFYGDYSKHKFYVDKAAELYDKTADVSVDGLSEKLERIFKENVKPDSYLKIKSGWFGTKVQLDSLTAANEDAKGIQVEVENTDNQHFQQEIKDRISELYEQLFFHEDAKLDFLSKSNRYRFTLLDYTFIDNIPVYILNFEPKGKKDFKGVMYVNTDDFAIVRLEFDNVRPLSKFGLLGITYRKNVFRGKMLFEKDGVSYSPKYLELEDGSYFGLDRPLRVIEKNKHVKGRRKQNELSLELKIKSSELIKYELVVFDSETMAPVDYEAVEENKNIKAEYLSAYDPSFWQGHSIIEPNAAIQSFKVLD